MNDYRGYLSHHGVLGMKWGIRRYQPYSIHPRKGGEGGKEVGLAKKHVGGTSPENESSFPNVKIKVKKKSFSQRYKEENNSTILRDFSDALSPVSRIAETVAKLIDVGIKIKTLRGGNGNQRRSGEQTKRLSREALDSIKDKKISEIDVSEMNRYSNIIYKVSEIERNVGSMNSSKDKNLQKIVDNHKKLGNIDRALGEVVRSKTSSPYFKPDVYKEMSRMLQNQPCRNEQVFNYARKESVDYVISNNDKQIYKLSKEYNKQKAINDKAVSKYASTLSKHTNVDEYSWTNAINKYANTAVDNKSNVDFNSSMRKAYDSISIDEYNKYINRR